MAALYITMAKVVCTHVYAYKIDAIRNQFTSSV
jgi:hypothetical protein